MKLDRKQRICDLLKKGIETGDQAVVDVISPSQYIQHNPQTQTGREGLAVLFKRISKTSPRVNIVRIFCDGNYVFGHTEYDFATSRIGFEVFRFEGDYTVEHWDNIQPRKGPNPAGHSMVDGPTAVMDLQLTEPNRECVKQFVETVLIANDLTQLTHFVSTSYIEHSPESTDGLAALKSTLSACSEDNKSVINYVKQHRILAQGNFVLSVSEGYLKGTHSALYDLYRLADGKIVEHWDTREAVPPLSEWENDNGKF